MDSKINEEQNPLGFEKVSTLLRKFAIPSIVAMLISSLYNVVDQIFIGQGVGYLGNAATNVAFPVTTITMAIALMIGVGSASRFSIELGRKNEKNSAACIGNALFMALSLGILCSVIMEVFITPLLYAFGATDNVYPYAFSYVQIIALGIPFLIVSNVMSNLIRADGSPKYSMCCVIVGAVLNIILDPIFIFTLDMGVAGGALATIISQIISALFALSYLFKFKRVKIKLSLSFLKPNFKTCTKIASLGTSSCFNQLFITLVQIVMNNSLTYYGALSIYGEDIPLSSFGVVMKVNSIFLAIFIGLSQGTQPIMGYNFGAEKYTRLKSVYKLAIACSFCVGIIGFLSFQIFPSYIVSLFGSGDPLYFEFAIKTMRTFLFMIFLTGAQILSSVFFSSIGMPIKGIILSLSRQVLFIIPLIIILPMFFGVEGIMYSAPISDLLSFSIAMIMVVREFKKMDKLNVSG